MPSALSIDASNDLGGSAARAHEDLPWISELKFSNGRFCIKAINETFHLKTAPLPSPGNAGMPRLLEPD